MEVPIYSIKGKASKKSAKLPDAFSEPVRLDLIRKAVRASRANRRQPYGATNGAGFTQSAVTYTQLTQPTIYSHKISVLAVT